MQERTRGTAEMVAAMAISGTIGWFVVTADQPLVPLIFWRCVFGAATLAAACAALGLLRPMPARSLALAAAGGVALVGNWLLIFGSFAHAPISVATAVYYVNPFVLVLLGAWMLGERPTRAQLAWLALAFGGVLLIAQGKGGGARGGGNYLLGLAMALGAAVLYAVSAALTKRLAGTPPQLVALVHTLVGSAMLAPFVLGRPLPAGPAQWAPLVVLGTVYTGAMYILLYGGLQRLPTALAGALGFVYPAVAIVVDYIAFDQRLQPAQWLGAVAILLAAAGATRARPTRAPATAAPPQPRPAP